MREILEEVMFVPRHDGGTVRAVLTGGDSSDLVVYQPGFEGGHRDALAYLTAYYLAENYGIPVARIDPFTSLTEGRNLSDEGVTLYDHVYDLKSVVDYIRREYGLGQGKVHGIGHSLSALPLVMAAMEPSIDLASIILWDGSRPTDPGLTGEDRLFYSSGGDYRISRDGNGFAIANSYLESIRQFRLPEPGQWHTPTLVVSAGGDPYLEHAGEVYEQRLQPAYRYTVPEADHNFLAKRRYTNELLGVTGMWLQTGFQTWPR